MMALNKLCLNKLLNKIIIAETGVKLSCLVEYDDNHDNDDDDDDYDDDDLYIIGAVCLSRFCLFHFLPFLDTFGPKNMRKRV